MGTYVNGMYLPAAQEIGWDDEVNANFRRLGDLGINVKAAPFNAVGDGVADDTAGIQAAIDAAEAIRQTGAGKNYMGATVYLPPGVYLITSTLTVEPGVPTLNFGTINLVGAGPQATWIKWGGGANPANGMIRMALVGAGGSNIGGLWRGFQLHGNDIASKGVYLTDINEMTFDSLHFNHFAVGTTHDACIYGTNVSSGCLLNTVQMCRFNGEENKGIYLSGGHGNRILSNEFHETAPGSLKLSGGDANIIAFNDFEGLTVDGTYSVEVDSPRTSVIYNRFEDITVARPAARCIKIADNQSNVGIIGNDFNEVASGGAPAYAVEIGNACSEILISGNMYTNPSGVCNIKVGTTCSNIQVMNEMNASAPSGHVEDNTTSPGSVIQGFSGSFRYGFDRLSLNSASIPTAGALLMKERASDASAPAANEGQIYLVDNGSGKTQLCVRFATGAVQVIATQP